jgi:hypothetical protein
MWVWTGLVLGGAMYLWPLPVLQPVLPWFAARAEYITKSIDLPQ